MRWDNVETTESVSSLWPVMQAVLRGLVPRCLLFLVMVSAICQEGMSDQIPSELRKEDYIFALRRLILPLYWEGLESRG